MKKKKIITAIKAEEMDCGNETFFDSNEHF